MVKSQTLFLNVLLILLSFKKSKLIIGLIHEKLLKIPYVWIEVCVVLAHIWKSFNQNRSINVMDELTSVWCVRSNCLGNYLIFFLNVRANKNFAGISSNWVSFSWTVLNLPVSPNIGGSTNKRKTNFVAV